mmetsp:Transcript_9615/g.23850  ORF Transcript_9615/g.23850 Transcript_9615/m.23850 type:complete len:251 (-) Transcript_9615:444-1196(-)
MLQLLVQRRVDEAVLLQRLHHAHALLPQLVHQRGQVQRLGQRLGQRVARQPAAPRARRQLVQPLAHDVDGHKGAGAPDARRAVHDGLRPREAGRRDGGLVGGRAVVGRRGRAAGGLHVLARALQREAHTPDGVALLGRSVVGPRVVVVVLHGERGAAGPGEPQHAHRHLRVLGLLEARGSDLQPLLALDAHALALREVAGTLGHTALDHVGEHHNEGHSVLEHHRPKVGDRGWQWPLRRDVRKVLAADPV